MLWIVCIDRGRIGNLIAQQQDLLCYLEPSIHSKALRTLFLFCGG